MKFFFRNLFYPAFFILFLFSFFLIEGDYKFYLFAAWSVFLLIFSHFLEKKHFSKSVLLAIILSVLFLISSIFSQHIPVSLEKLLFYFLSLAIFNFFSLLSKDKFNQKLFLYYLSIVTLILNLFVLFFTFFDPQPDIFPGMNLLVRSYGHNHFVAFLLLVIPIFWWQFLFVSKEKWFSKKEIKVLAITLLISSYLIIIFSLARLALLISLIQLVVIFLINKKTFLNANKNAFTIVLAKTFIFAFLSISSVFLFLSIPFNQKGENICPLIFTQKELCKPILANDRFIYWQKAWAIFKKYPYFGSGLKTFNFASRQFPSDDYKITSYAHNIFLHNLAEGGLFAGGLFIFFICYLFYQSFLVVKKNKNPLNHFLLIAAFSSLANAFFDFDWHFFVIFTLTLIFLAMILQNKSSLKKVAFKAIDIKVYFVCIAVVANFFALTYFSSDILRRKNQTDLVINLFPYFNALICYLIDENKLSINNYESIYKLYKNDPNFIYNFSMLEDLNMEKKVQLQIELAQIDPLLFVQNINFLNIDYKTAEPLIDRYFEITNRYHLLDDYSFIFHEERFNLFEQLFALAGKAYQDNQPALAAKLYKQSMILNPFVTDSMNVVFLDDTNFARATIFLLNFKDFDPEKMHKYTDSYMLFYERTLIYLFQNDQLDDFFILSEAMFEKRPDFSWFLFNDLIKISSSSADKQRLQKIYDHFQDMPTWHNFLPLPK